MKHAQNLQHLIDLFKDKVCSRVTKIDRAFWLFFLKQIYCIIVVVFLYSSLSTALDEGFATWQTFHYGKKEHIAMNGILVIWT